jgi:hypothetical protein
MTYQEIEDRMPHVAAARSADKLVSSFFFFFGFFFSPNKIGRRLHPHLRFADGPKSGIGTLEARVTRISSKG